MVKRRMELIDLLMEKIKEYMQLQEDILGCEEDIERVKSLIYLGEQDNKYLKTVRDDLKLQLLMIHEKTDQIVSEQQRYKKVLKKMAYHWDREEDEIHWLEQMIKVRTEELSWWQYEWEDHTHPYEPEMKWVLQATQRQVKNTLHIAVHGDPIDEQVAIICNQLPLMVKVVRLDVGDYLFGKHNIYCELYDSDGDDVGELYATVAPKNHRGETLEPPELKKQIPNPAAGEPYHDPEVEVGAEIDVLNPVWHNMAVWVNSHYKEEHLHWKMNMNDDSGSLPVRPPKIAQTGAGAKNRMSIMPGTNQFVRQGSAPRGTKKPSGPPGRGSNAGSPRASVFMPKDLQNDDRARAVK